MVVAALNILAVCDPGAEYGQRLAQYAGTKAGYPFELQAFSSLDQLLRYREKKKPEAVLLDSALYSEKDWEEYDNPLFLLSSGLGRDNEPKRVFRYQEADGILKDILMLYREEHPRLEMQVEKRGFCLYAVTDGTENCRSESLAFELAVQLAKKERVLLLDLRTWPVLRKMYGCPENGGSGDILYGLCRRKEDLMDQLMEKIVSVNDVDLFPEVEDPADLLEVTVEDWKYLMERLKSESPYTAVLAVTGNVIQPLGEFLELFDVIFMVWEDVQMVCQNRMEKYLKNTACPQLWQRITGIQMPSDTVGKSCDRAALRQLAVKTLRETEKKYGSERDV